MPIDVKTPELDKRLEIMRSQQSPNATLTDFLDWLRDEQGIRLCKWTTHQVEEPCFQINCNGGKVNKYRLGLGYGRSEENCPTCNGTGWTPRDKQEWIEDTRRPEQLFADFFGIDLDKIEAEQRALLQAIRGSQRPL